MPIPFQSWLAFAIAPFIFLPLPMYTEFKSGAMSALTESVLLHERTHIKRQRAAGLLIFGWKYLTNKHFRLQEELAAIEAQMRFLKSCGEVYNIERMARFFASSTYGYVLTYDDAHRTLSALWERVY